MSDNKKYYWIKLKNDFFDLPAIDWLRGQKNGCEYIVLYQKLCLLSANSGGCLAVEIGEMLMRFDENKISRATGFDLDTVIVALELFKKLGLILVQENDILTLPDVPNMIGSETKWAEKKRLARAKYKDNQGTLSQTETGTLSDKSIEIRDKSIEIELDIDKERDNSGSDEPSPSQKATKHKYGEHKNVLLTDEEYQKLIAKPNGTAAIEFLSAYIAEKPYKSKSHYLAICRWVFNAVGERQSSKPKREGLSKWDN